MRVLFLSNYSPYEKVKNGLMPSQHLFGFKELPEDEYKVDYVEIRAKKNKIFELMYEFYLALKFSLLRRYDVIYDSLAVIERGMGILKRFKILSQKYVVVMHHPPFEKRLEICKYDAMMFLDEVAYNEMKEKFPNQAAYMNLNVWGPDLSFYDSIIQKLNFEIENPLIFISNGKTQRDHELLVEASSKIKDEVIIVCDKNTIPSNYRNQSNVSLYFQDKPDDRKMIKLLQTCSVMVIPTLPSHKRLGCIGNTSFMDAIALGMPIIVADNSVMSNIVFANSCGLVYHAGDLSSLVKCMQNMSNKRSLKRMGANARSYAERINMVTYSKKNNEILQKIMYGKK